jgi:hypothetical protein
MEQPQLVYEGDKKVADVEAKMPFLEQAQQVVYVMPQQQQFMSYPPQPIMIPQIQPNQCCDHSKKTTVKVAGDGFPISLAFVT